MRISKKMSGVLTAAVASLWAGSAAAQSADEEWPATVYGVSVSVGGGVQDFTDADMQDTTDIGGMWDVRAVIGTRTPIALEAAYTGSAQAIDSRFGEENTATLVGTGVEGALRLNLIPLENITPYGVAGLGWRRYDVTGADFRTADVGIADEDTLLEIPLGGGLAYRFAGFTADARFTYRAAVGEDLVISDDELPDEQIDSDAGKAGMDNWNVSARIGWEF